ncbi:hypothetical protein RLIN73S_01618 [Rhodanobacter lindaniclasticus]
MSRPNEWRSNRAAERIAPTGLATPLPAMSGAEPWIGSYKPALPSPSDADGNSPSEPASAAASSVRMSPNRFSVTTTSYALGRVSSSIAIESTSWCSTVTSV